MLRPLAEAASAGDPGRAMPGLVLPPRTVLPMVDRNQLIIAPLDTGESDPDPADVAANDNVPSAESSLHMAKWHYNKLVDLEERGPEADEDRTRQERHAQTFDARRGR
jgi:hypothetical protein